MAEINKLENTVVQINTDYFQIRMKDSAFSKLLTKMQSKKGKRLEEFLEETIGNMLKKRRGVKVSGNDWDNAVDDIMKVLMKEM